MSGLWRQRCRRHRWALLIALVFLIGVCVIQPSGLFYNSPDENANAVAATHWAQSGQLWQVESLNSTLSRPVVYPRSMVPHGDRLVPTGFLGLPVLYGSIAKVAGTWILPWLTPLFATLGLLAFYYCLLHLWSSRVAILSMLLLALHPAWLYYSWRGLLPNVLFFSLWCLALAAWSYGSRRHWAWSLVAGLLLGWAIVTRAVEIWWVLPVTIIWIWSLPPRSRWSWVGAGVGMAAVAGLFMFIHAQVYGSPLATGYTLTAFTADTAAATTPVLLPFGFSLWLIVKNKVNYLGRLVWWYGLPTILAVVWVGRAWWRRRLPAAQQMYIAVTVVVSVWLVVYYGSWAVRDNVANAITIGTSFVRYWIPVYALWLPVMAAAIVTAAKRFPPQWRTIILSGVVGVIAGASMWLAVYGTNESMVAVAESLHRYEQTAEAIAAIVPPSSVIVTSRNDKVFWPRWSVISAVDAVDSQTVATLEQQGRPVYLYTADAKADVSRLTSHGLRAEAVYHGPAPEVLYRLTAPGL